MLIGLINVADQAAYIGAEHFDMYKILLVEDNLVYRSTLKSALLRQLEDLEVKEFNGSTDILSTVQTFYPDLILMDIELKRSYSGLDMTEQVKSNFPEIVVVIHSQHDNKEYRTAASQSGADFFLSKGCSLQHILDCIGFSMKVKGTACSSVEF